MDVAELQHERAYVDAAYGRVAEMRAAAKEMARAALESVETRNAQAMFERDSAVTHAGRRLAALDGAMDRLIVGRLDLLDGTCLYVGRLAVTSDRGDPLVVDWRAPAAERFYRALPHDPMGVVRRRHFRWRDGELVGLDDEVFDLAAADEAGLSLAGEGALLAALDAPRTGRMHDVVATIQAQQDVVIRSPRRGVTVVQGAPGTGKTAVVLHRAAYLLYSDRSRLAGAVLFVGPSSTFLRYVENVVPSLGEDRVVLATPADLGPAVAVTRSDPPLVASIKGDLRMVDVLNRGSSGSSAGTAGRDRDACGSIPPLCRSRDAGCHHRHRTDTIEHTQRRPGGREDTPHSGAGERVPKLPRARPPHRSCWTRSGPVRPSTPRCTRQRRSGQRAPVHVAPPDTSQART